MEYILRTYNLSKKYRNAEVVNKLNINIKKGDIYGFLGENGAGKTTTLRMLMGLVKPTSGEIEFFGQSNFKKDVYKKVGAIIENCGYYPNLTAEENLEIHRRMVGIENEEYIKEALDMVGLDIKEIKNKKVKKFSLGMKQRLGIARAILHKPEFLILDEPSNGLDPSGIKMMREILLELNKKREMTILMSSHILGEVQQIANRIGIIHNGVLLKEMEYNEIENKNRHYLNIKVSDDKRACVVLEKELDIWDYKVEESNLIRVYEKLDEASKISKVLINNEIYIEELIMKNDNLEEYFIKLTGGGLNA